MRFLMFRVATTLAVAFMVTVVWAQAEPKPLPAPQMGNTILSRPFLMEPAVQQELGLTEKQVAQLQQLANNAMRANQNALNGPEAAGGEFDFNTMLGNLDKTAKQQHAAIGKLLTPVQKSRINEIELQREGWPALGRPEVARRVKLSRSQYNKVQQILGEMRMAQTNSMFQSSLGGTPATINPQSPIMKNLNPSNGFLDMSGTFAPDSGPLTFPNQDLKQTNETSAETGQKIQTDAAEKVAAILTPDQKNSFAEMIGAPFDFKKLNQPAPPPSTHPVPTSTGKPASPKPARSKS